MTALPTAEMPPPPPAKPLLIMAVQVWHVMAGLCTVSYFAWAFVNVMRAPACSDLCGVSQGVLELVAPSAILLGAVLLMSGVRLGQSTARGWRTTSLVIQWLVAVLILVSLPDQVAGASSYGLSTERILDFVLSLAGLLVTGLGIYAIGFSQDSRKYYLLHRR